MNKSAQFTPGPWKAVPDKSRNMYTWYVEGAKGVVPTIARLSLIDACEEIEGNATLIAAAPAMYAELVNGLGLLEASYHDMCDKYGKDSMQAEVVWDQVERTRNVIAQAEGRRRT